ncbi:MAG TPA: UDP-phosphate galactose phosphotransferase [Enterococcus sp.]|nr:UDP-phosphate galactose phosphotransferase [Enterococcus sp.]
MDDFEASVFQKDSNNLNLKMWIDRSTLERKKLYFISKRFLDIVLSMIGLVMLLPLFMFVAILIKIEDPSGSIFFSQTRMGKEKKEFKMYKFRSMCVDAENKLDSLLKFNEIEGAMFKIKNDPRVTKIGKLLRKTSIDELPQLFNVLKGDMSLVGPRPPLTREVIEYTEYDLQRLYVKPGCTGLWQVSGRNKLSFSQMVNLDIEYIDNLSVYNDIKIILKTIFIMIKPNSAY